MEPDEAGSLLNVTRDLGTSVGITMTASLLSWRSRLLAGRSSTLSASAADPTPAIEIVVIAVALLALLAVISSWMRPAGPPAAHERWGEILNPSHQRESADQFQTALRNRCGENDV